MGKKSENSLGGLWDDIRMTNIHITDVQEGKIKGQKSRLKNNG